MKEMMIILFSVILVDNFVLSKFLGICPFLGVSKNIKSAVSMSGAVIFVMVMATAITWPIYSFLLEPNKLGYLQTIIFILVIAAMVQVVEIIFKRFLPALNNALGIYLPLITTNCAVLGVTILNIDNSYTFLQSLVNSLGAGLGFMLAMVIFVGVRMRIAEARLPEAFDGLPATLVAAAIVAIAFGGFAGMVDGIFA